MNIYEIYVCKKHSDAPIELLSDGFSWLAAIFSPFWALYHRMWLFAVFIIILNVIINYLQISTNAASFSFTIQLFCILFFGLFASDIRELHLKHKGYDLQDVVIANSETEAELKFLQRKNHYLEMVQKSEKFNDL